MAPLLGRSRVFTCAIIHDFIPLEMPQAYLAETNALRAYANNFMWLRYFHLFLPTSQYSGRKLSELLGVDKKRVEVTGIAVRETLLSYAATVEDRLRGTQPMFKGRYFLIVGGDDPRKNVESALQAHAELISQHSMDAGLVVLGSYSETGREALRIFFTERGGSKNQIEFVEGLSDQDLAGLYRQAIATICPSFIEGFSMPVIEALACGCPVIASNCDAHQELVPQEDALFPPGDISRIKKLMNGLISSPGKRSELLKEQRSIVPRFLEQEVCRRFWIRVICDYEAYKKRVTKRRPSEKPRIAILSPYPPDRSGVAEYTAQSIQTISRHATIDVFTNAHPTSPESSVRRFDAISSFPYVVDEYERVVAVIGNSHFHKEIITLFSQYGGTAIVHDNRLAELYYWWYGPRTFAEMSSRSLGREVSVDESESWIRDPSRLPSIFFDEIIPMAETMIVHSRGIQKQVKKQYGFACEYLPFCCYRHFQEEELEEGSRTQARKRLGIPQDKIMIITMGLVSSSKGPLECVWAVEQLIAWGLPVSFFFVGSSEHYAGPLHDLIDQLGIHDHVHTLNGWLSNETYRDYLLAADFAIQIRSHRLGGLSGAVMDCISAGLTTVCNMDLAESMEAPDFVLRVPDNFSPILMAERIMNSFQERQHATRLTGERLAYLKEHSFDIYAERIMSALGLPF